MTINNINLPGIRWVRGKNNASCHPPILNVPIASGYAPAVDPGTANYAVGALAKGDPISRLSTGYGQLCPGNEDASATGTIFGIMAAVGEGGYWDGTEMKFGSVLPSGVTYGTNESRRTYIKVIPAAGQVFDAAVSNDGVASKADMLALLQENCDHRLTMYDTGAAGDRALPKIDFTATPTTTAQWRIWDFSKAVELRDYAGTDPRVEVTVVESLEPEFSAAGV